MRSQAGHFVGRGKHLTVLLYLLLNPFADEVGHLTDAHEDADGGGNHHEQREDPFLCWTGYVAVHRVGTGLLGAFGQAG